MIGMAAVCGVGPRRAADFQPVDLRQHQIEDQQIGRPFGERPQRLAARREQLHDVVGLLEITA